MLRDEVWGQLDPWAGRLAPRTPRRLALALLVLLVVAEAGVVAWVSGLAAPRIRMNKAGGSSATMLPGPGFDYSIELENHGWLPATVTGLGGDQAGLRLSTTVRSPVILRPGQSMQITVAYEIIDCAAVTNDPASLPVRVERFWGSQTVYVDLPRRLPPGFQGMWWGEPPMAWNKYWAEQACAYSWD